MITPAYLSSGQAQILPRLALDFTTGSLDPRISFARASIGTRVNPSGLVETMSANTPRFDYDPVTLAPKGLLIEEQRANAVTYSEDFGNVIWTKSNASISTDTTTSPSGASTADTLIENTANSTHFVQYASSVSGTAAVFSFYAKKKERSKIAFGGAGFGGQGFVAVWDLNNGTIFTNTGNKASIQALSNGWYRCSVAFTPSNATGAVVFLCDDAGNITYTGDGTSGVYLWGFQSENGTILTSYIPTTTAAVTRNLDLATMTGANFSSWFNASQGAFSVASQRSVAGDGLTAFPPILEAVNSGAANTNMLIQWNTGTGEIFLYSQIAGAGQAFITKSGLAATVAHKSCYAYKSSDYAYTSDGLTPGTSGGNVPTVDVLNIGSQSSLYAINGWIGKILYWPQRIINNEVQAFSK